ncbi:MAG: hypothetical protein GC164_03015 [Phycisphaera sp.]|nr:hypothetical protein [Phycisphaera sp.]
MALLRRINTRSAFHRILLLMGSTLMALVTAELLSRVFVPPQPNIRFQQDVDELRGLSLNDAAQMIENDPELFWRLVPDTRISADAWPFFGVISNRQSLREDHDIPLQKPQSETRVLFLGDSCTFGYGVAQDQTFVEQAQALLRERTGRPVECINAGVPGYTLFQGYRYLATQGLRYQPDLVVLNFGWNDATMWDRLGDREHYARSMAAQPPAPLRWSRLCQLLWGLRSPTTPVSSGELRPRLLPTEFAQTLDDIHTLLEGQHIPVLILVWPLRMNTEPTTPTDARTELQSEMIAFGQTHPLSTEPEIGGVLDLVPLGRELVRERGTQAIYFDPGHVTPAAHRAIAVAIADHLTAWLKR